MYFDITKFALKPEYFDINSPVHGIGHTYRVMCNVLAIGSHLELEKETKLAFCAAFIHDMARQNDGVCRNHGRWAAEFKLPLFENWFEDQNITKAEIDEIRSAIIGHSQGFEFEKSHPHYITTALLKDADALDRIRVGKHNLNLNYLRFEGSYSFVDFAESLFVMTFSFIPSIFEALDYTTKILGIKDFVNMVNHKLNLSKI